MHGILPELLIVLMLPTERDIEEWLSGAPRIKLLLNAGIAALIFPAHAFFETKIKVRLTK